MDKLIVKVTRDDIRRGVRKKVNVCGCIDVGEKCFTLPYKADKFITAFDNGKPVKPFTFVAKRNDYYYDYATY